MSPPDITVVLPVWNLDEPFSEAVTALLAQDEPARLVVVDNASERPLPQFSEVEVIRTDRRLSVGAARNTGLELVSTPYVLFAEADDLVLPGTLGYLRNQLTHHSDAVACAGAWEVWNPRTGVRTRATWPLRYAYTLSRWRRTFAIANCIRNLFPTTGPVLMCTEQVRAAGGFGDSCWAEDWVLGAALCFQGRILMSRRISALYRSDPGRTSLSDLKEGRWSPSWRGRANVRGRLRSNPLVPRPFKALVPALVPFHFMYTVHDLFLKRQRA